MEHGSDKKTMTADLFLTPLSQSLLPASLVPRVLGTTWIPLSGSETRSTKGARQARYKLFSHVSNQKGLTFTFETAKFGHEAD